MTKILSVVLLLSIVCYFGIIFSLLKKRVLLLKYTLLWLAVGIGLLILVLFPRGMYFISGLVGIETPVNCLFLFMIAFLFIIAMSMTAIISKQSERIKKLTRQIAILDKRLRDMEEKVKET